MDKPEAQTLSTLDLNERPSQKIINYRYRRHGGREGPILGEAFNIGAHHSHYSYGEIMDSGEKTLARLDGHGKCGGREDDGKIRVELLPFDALTAVAEVLTFGAAKYSDRNWEKGMKWSRVAGSMLRHAFARLRGEERDPETGLRHTAHIACNALFLLAYELRGIGDNDLRLP